MKTGHNRLTPGEVKDQLLQARRTYKQEKTKLVEHFINSLEAKTNAWLVALFVGLILVGWLSALFLDVRVKKLYDSLGFYPIIIVFFISYFAFFFVSKIVFKPSPEEREDDTSYIALFSACEGRAQRGLISAALGVLHTAVFVAYLVIKETRWLD